MALIKLDVKTLQMSVEVGILEEYKPDDSITALLKEANTLRDNTTAYVLALTNTSSMQEAIQALNADQPKLDQWNEYMKVTYIPAVQSLASKITEKNKQICPGYKEHLESQSH